MACTGTGPVDAAFKAIRQQISNSESIRLLEVRPFRNVQCYLYLVLNFKLFSTPFPPLLLVLMPWEK